MFDLITKVINDKQTYYAYAEIEDRRKGFLHSSKIIEVIDLGAGLKTLSNSKRKISDIAARSLKRPKYAQLLFRLVNYFQPETILELGTSLGITTIYLASANKTTKVVTIEGSATIANEAQELFKRAGIKNIESVVGNFDEVLGKTIYSSLALRPLSLIYFDGNHRKEPTLNYFQQCLKYSHNNSIYIFDDIHWSAEMEQAWEEIKKHPQITVTIDLFEIGIVFFRTELTKQNFVVRY